MDAGPARAALEGSDGFEGSQQVRPGGWTLFSTTREILAREFGLLLNQCTNLGYVSGGTPGMSLGSRKSVPYGGDNTYICIDR